MASVDHDAIRATVSRFVEPYLARNPTARAAVDALASAAPNGAADVHWDHLAFRSFDRDGCGVDAVARVFLDLGYVPRDELRFPKKKLLARWYAPPDPDPGGDPCATHPRVFISHVLADRLSPAARDVVAKYTTAAAEVPGAIASAAAAGSRRPWGALVPTREDYETLAAESEYAAWVLVHGYSLNHVAVSVHRLVAEGAKRMDVEGRMKSAAAGGGGNGGEANADANADNADDNADDNAKKKRPAKVLTCLEDVNALLSGPPYGFALNGAEDDSVVKVSPDGLLRQSSTVADVASVTFEDGGALDVPSCYVEFAERLPLPQFAGDATITEAKRRDGFEVGNADPIFESTNARK